MSSGTTVPASPQVKVVHEAPPAPAVHRPFQAIIRCCIHWRTYQVDWLTVHRWLSVVLIGLPSMLPTLRPSGPFEVPSFEHSKSNFVRRAVRCSIKHTIRISVILRSIGGSNQSTIDASNSETIWPLWRPVLWAFQVKLSQACRPVFHQTHHQDFRHITVHRWF